MYLWDIFDRSIRGKYIHTKVLRFVVFLTSMYVYILCTFVLKIIFVFLKKEPNIKVLNEQVLINF